MLQEKYKFRTTTLDKSILNQTFTFKNSYIKSFYNSLLNTNRYILLLVVLLLLGNKASCQEDYKPGYIITNENDTVQGFINLKTNITNSKQCDFKTSMSAEATIYAPRDIYAYRIDDIKYYCSKQITRADTTATIFLEFLINGVVNLYYMKTYNQDYYYVEKNGQLHELSNEEHIVKDKYNVAYAKNSNKYLGTLNYLFNDAPDLKSDLNHTTFAYKPLIKITKKYHNQICNNDDCIEYRKSTKHKIYLEPYGGFINSWMTIKESDYYLYSFTPVIGFNVRFPLLQSNYLFNTILGLNYSDNNFSGLYIMSEYTESPKNDKKIKLKYDILKIPLLIEYTFPLAKIQPHISAGISNNILLNPDYVVKKVYVTDGYRPQSTEATILRTYQAGIMVGIGIKYKLQNDSYFTLRNDFECRFPVQRTGYVLDYHTVYSVLINLGYGFRIK